METLSIVSWNT